MKVQVSALAFFLALVSSVHSYSRTGENDLSQKRRFFTQCVLDNNTHKVNQWLEQGWNPNYRLDIDTATSLSPLGIAISRGYLHMMDTLLKNHKHRYSSCMEADTLRDATRFIGESKYRQKGRACKVLGKVLEAGLLPKHHQTGSSQLHWNTEALYAAAEFGFPEVFVSIMNSGRFNPDGDVLYNCMLLSLKNPRSKDILHELATRNKDDILRVNAEHMSPAKLAYNNKNYDAIQMFVRLAGERDVLYHLGFSTDSLDSEE